MADVTRELAFLLTGKDVSASRTMKGVGREVSNLERHSSKAARNIGRNVERGVVVGATAAAGALGFAVKQAIDRESAIAGIAKTVDGDIQAVVKSLTDLSNRVPMSFEELAGIAELGGAMGIAKDDLVDFTEQVAILGTTTNVSVEDAATALGQMQNVLGLTGDEFDNFAAALVDLGNKGNSTEAQILEIARRSGGAAKLIGVAKDETLGWASAAANLGLQEELAGTALQNFFVKTQTAISAGGEDLETFAEISGRTTAQIKKDWQKDATGSLTRFLKGLSGLTKGQRIKAIQSIYGKGSGMTRLLIGLADSIDSNLNPSLKTNAEAWEAATAAQEEAEKRFATTESQLIILRNNIDNAAATIGTELLPVINELAKEGVDWLGDNADEIEQFGKDLAVNIREAVTWAKSLDWDGIANALGIAAGGAKSLVDVFTSLPPEVMAILAGAFGVNKLTGGVVVDIAGGFFKDQFFSRGASPANPMYVVPVGQGLVPGGAVGAGKGGATSILGKFGRAAFTLGTVYIAAESISALATAFGEFQTTVKTAQTGLKGDVDATRSQDFDTTIANLRASSANIGQDWLGANLLKSVFGGSEIQQNFDMAAQRIIDAGDLTREDLLEAKAALTDARAAIYDITGNTKAIDAALASVEKRLLTAPVTNPELGPRKGGPVAPSPRPTIAPTTGFNTALRDPRWAQQIKAEQEKTTTAALAAHRATEQAGQATRTGLSNNKAATEQSARNLAANQARLSSQERGVITAGATRTVVAEGFTRMAVAIAGAAGVAATYGAAGIISAAIARNRAVVNVSPTTVQNTTVYQRRTGTSTGSRSGPLEY